MAEQEQPKRQAQDQRHNQESSLPEEEDDDTSDGKEEPPNPRGIPGDSEPASQVPTSGDEDRESVLDQIPPEAVGITVHPVLYQTLTPVTYWKIHHPNIHSEKDSRRKYLPMITYL
ncbi:hypothetical protein EOD39_3576 [Acipenser ruthenus]|uniref:Uncharacterized protein n=1 Tax=Acipenser ruthenus TaxID=7906 RepID=A0A444UMC5_ACIRT|nr:hypothetical protein EOD39_3576 [Acipenser ruthenus]